MRVGLLELELQIPESASLKTKRRAIRPLVDRMRARLNVSVAEVGCQDAWQRCQLAVAAVATDDAGIHSLLDQAQAVAESCPDVLCTVANRQLW